MAVSICISADEIGDSIKPSLITLGKIENRLKAIEEDSDSH
jgi:hypothetical protein